MSRPLRLRAAGWLAAGVLALAAAPAAAQEGTAPAAPATETREPPPQTTEPARPARRRPDPNLITREEIAEARVRTGQELVTRLRPRWLRTRGSGQVETGLGQSSAMQGPATTMDAPGIDVFLDDTHLGKARTTLANLSLAGVVAVQFYSPAQATTRFGTGYGYGVIQFLTR